MSAIAIDANEVASAIAPLISSSIVDQVLKRLEELPPERRGGVIVAGASPDGGTADKELKSFGDFLLAVKRNDRTRLTKVYQAQYVAEGRDGELKATVAEGSGSTGGYLVPQQFLPELMSIAGESSIVRPRATKIPMVSRTLLVPALDQTITPGAGQSAFYGGVVAKWTGEQGAITEAEPQFKQVELIANKLALYSQTTNEASADSAITIEALLKTLYGGAIGWTEDYNFIRGDGVAKPLGILNANATIGVTRTTSNQFKIDDAANMLSRLAPGSLANACWIIHPFLMPYLVKLVVSGTGTGAVAWMPDLRSGTPGQLLGLPIYFSEKASAPGSKGDVILADFSRYLIGDRQELQVAMSEHFKFTTDLLTWRATYRVDGQPWLSAPITLADGAGTNTVSPFVVLNA